jgi:hypothetical protein
MVIPMLSAEIVRDLFLARLQPAGFTLDNQLARFGWYEIHRGEQQVHILRQHGGMMVYITIDSRHLRRTGANMRLRRMRVPGLGSLRVWGYASTDTLRYTGFMFSLHSFTGLEVAEVLAERIAGAMLA